MKRKLIGLLIVLFWYATGLFSLALFGVELVDHWEWLGPIVSFPPGESNSLFWMTLWMTLVVFIASTLHKNASIYDPYWSVLPMLFVLISPIMHLFEPTGLREYFVLGVVWLWGIRLTGNWIYTWPGLHHQDWRYTELKEKTGAWYPLVNFLGIHLFPTLIVFVAYLPVVEVFAGNRPALHLLDFVALAIGIGAVILQGIADFQMHRFRKSNTGKINDKGLWGWSRHPNYLGEILFWFALFLFGVSSGLSLWPYLLCPLAMLALFLFISIPMMEKRQAKKEGWDAYTQRVGMLFPRMKKTK